MDAAEVLGVAAKEMSTESGVTENPDVENGDANTNCTELLVILPKATSLFK